MYVYIYTYVHDGSNVNSLCRGCKVHPILKYDLIDIYWVNTYSKYIFSMYLYENK